MAAPGRMTLFSSHTSPFSRKVRVVAAETGADRMIDEIIADPFQPPPELLAANPLSRIPTLVTETGEALPDSSLIIGYLSTRGSGLTPQPRGRARWTALRLLTIADGVIDSAVQAVLEKRRPESIVYTAFLDRKHEVIRRSLAMLETDAGRLLPATDKPSVLEVTVGVALAYLDFRMPYLEWREACPLLAEWQRAFAQRAAMVKTQPPV